MQKTHCMNCYWGHGKLGCGYRKCFGTVAHRLRRETGHAETYVFEVDRWSAEAIMSLGSNGE
jgi:hypothetical protein